MRTTTPPSRPTVLYDGHCRFCVAQMRRLERFLPRGRYDALSFQDAGVLDRFPGLSHDEAMRALQYIDEGGRIFAGVEAVVQALGLRAIGKLALVYYVPGIRQALDAIYRKIARNRYRLAGTTCEDGTCALHGPRAPK
jgi:predicted DCC family thiol-disulfide oxidoreductase YuxK